MHRLAIALATVAFVATVWLANWLIVHVGPIRVWPTDLLAPAGVYVVGLAFVLRDFIQYRSSRWLALGAIAAGTILSYLIVSHAIAKASAAGFLAAEAIGLLTFWALQRWSVVGAVLCAGVVAAALDSYVFLSLAPQFIPGLDNVQTFFEGQFVAKVTMSVLAIPFVIGTRRWVPRPGAS